ncbi:MAG: hypothetical protein ACYSUV_02070 [Planctomycetota bacterium]
MEIEVTEDMSKTAKAVAEKYNFVLKQFRERSAKLLEEFSVNPSHALHWNTEGVMDSHHLTLIWLRAVTATLPFDDINAKKGLTTIRDELATHLARFPHRHNSTSVLANLEEECEAHAKSSFVQEASGILEDYRYI